MGTAPHPSELRKKGLAMSLPSEPLRYPTHYPPTTRWKKFFIGVRWLGPDLSFFKPLHAQQKNRTADLLGTWGGGARQALAIQLGVIFSRHLHWPSAYFIPDDRFLVVTGGPRFGMIDNFEIEDAISEIEASLVGSIGREFWQSTTSLTLSELVDRLLEARAPR